MRIKKYIYTIVLLMLFLPFVTKVSKADGILCEGDTVVLLMEEYYGDLKWEKSEDLTDFMPIQGATVDSFEYVVHESTYFRAVITDSNCVEAYISDTIFVEVNLNPTIAIAGTDSIDIADSTFVLNANTPDVGAGEWSIISGIGGSFDDLNDPQTIFNGQAGESYVLRWTISNPPCIESFDEVTISFEDPTPPIPANLLVDCGLIQLHVHPTDNSTGTSWGCTGGIVAGADSDVDGKNNTTLIVQNCPPPTAAEICDNLVAEGYSDWYLPAKDELTCLYNEQASIGGFSATTYWTSSEGSAFLSANAWYRNFGSTLAGYGSKNNVNRVRCVRQNN
ncbi:MAG: DUF1566 domain-containing protein [Chitinophagaceae bacterium]|nr:MAG: DUF1566 domain-containing protein [Chitinophagaceae bacterium]